MAVLESSSACSDVGPSVREPSEEDHGLRGSFILDPISILRESSTQMESFSPTAGLLLELRATEMASEAQGLNSSVRFPHEKQYRREVPFLCKQFTNHKSINR